jgi:hypothetical protein
VTAVNYDDPHGAVGILTYRTYEQGESVNSHETLLPQERRSAGKPISRISIMTGIALHGDSPIHLHTAELVRDIGRSLGGSSGLELVRRDGPSAASAYEGNRFEQTRSRRPSGMSMIVPIALGTLSIVTLLEHGMQIGAAPWYFLAYLAYDSYSKAQSEMKPTS